MPAKQNLILRNWRRLHAVPGGRALFTRLVCHRVPYSGTMGARVLDLSPGFARAELRDRRAVRNHLGSIHAIALANLGELTSGLAMSCGFAEHVRGIVSRLEIDYLKKARGTITARCECVVPKGEADEDVVIQAKLTDSSNDPVATVTAHWKVGPMRREPFEPNFQVHPEKEVPRG